MNKAPWIVVIAVGLIAVLFWWIHTPEIQWYAARSYTGKKVTVVGPVIRGTLDSPDGLVTMTMGVPDCESPPLTGNHRCILRSHAIFLTVNGLRKILRRARL